MEGQAAAINDNVNQRFVCQPCGYIGTLMEMIGHVIQDHLQVETAIQIYPVNDLPVQVDVGCVEDGEQKVGTKFYVILLYYLFLGKLVPVNSFYLS